MSAGGTRSRQTRIAVILLHWTDEPRRASFYGMNDELFAGMALPLSATNVRVLQLGGASFFCFTDVCKQLGVSDLAEVASLLRYVPADLWDEHTFLGVGGTESLPGVLLPGLVEFLVRCGLAAARPFTEHLLRTAAPELLVKGSFRVAAKQATPGGTAWGVQPLRAMAQARGYSVRRFVKAANEIPLAGVHSFTEAQYNRWSTGRALPDDAFVVRAEMLMQASRSELFSAGVLENYRTRGPGRWNRPAQSAQARAAASAAPEPPASYGYAVPLPAPDIHDASTPPAVPNRPTAHRADPSAPFSMSAPSDAYGAAPAAGWNSSDADDEPYAPLDPSLTNEAVDAALARIRAEQIEALTPQVYDGPVTAADLGADDDGSGSDGGFEVDWDEAWGEDTRLSPPQANAPGDDTTEDGN